MTDYLNKGLQFGNALLKAIAGTRSRNEIARQSRETRVEHNAMRQNPPPVYGSARWATPGELREALVLRDERAFDDPSSIRFGTMDGGEVHWDGAGHLMTVAPTRTGKSETVIVQNLLRYRGACVVLDPKGELYEFTSAWRAKEVGPVYRIAPFEAETNAFNPLADLASTGDARQIADLLIPDDQHAQDFFKRDAVTFLTSLILYLVKCAPPERRTFTELRSLIALDRRRLAESETNGLYDNDLDKLLWRMSEHPDPVISEGARVARGKHPQRGLPTLIDTLNSNLAIWSEPEIVRATARAEVDFKALKDRPATVYISVPFIKMDAYAPFLKVLLVTALDAMIVNPAVPAIPVLFVLDEFLSLGAFPKFQNALRTHAGAGVRLWFFLQDIHTLEEHYPHSWRSFMDASVRLYFGTRDPTTAQYISESIGTKTDAYGTASVTLGRSANVGGPLGSDPSISSSVTQSVNLAGRPLLAANEVQERLKPWRAHSTREGLVWLDQVPRPFLFGLSSYKNDPRLEARVGRVGHMSGV